MAAHGLVNVHGMQAGNVKAGEPHVAHDHDLQRIRWVFHPVRQILPLLFRGVMFRDHGAVGAAGGHHHLDDAFRWIVIMPARPDSDDLIVQVNGNPAAHGHHQGLAVKNGLPYFKMGDNIPGQVLHPVGIADNGLQFGPFDLGLLFFSYLFILFELVVKLPDQPFALFIEVYLCQPTLVIDANGGTVGHGLGDVIHIHVLSEHGRGIHVGSLDGGAGEAYISGIGQGIAHVLGKTVGDALADHLLGNGILFIQQLCFKSILGAVCLVGNHHDVPPFGEGVVGCCSILGKEFLDGGEDDAATGHLQQLFQLIPAFGLHGFLPQQLSGGGEGAEQLVVEVVAVGEHHDGGILHLGRNDQFAGKEDHAQAFSRSLRMPHHTAPLVAMDA